MRAGTMPVMDVKRASNQLSRRGRLAMAAVVAGASTLIALLSHVLAGGPLPEAHGVLVPLALALVVCLPLTGRLRSLPRLVPAVVLSQLLYHWLFVLGAPSTGALIAVESGAPLTGHEGHAFMLIGGADAASADALMWAAHGAAAIVTIALIRRGETVLLGLQRLLVLLASAILPAMPTAAPLGARPVRLAVVDVVLATSAARRLAATVTRRGPPRRTAFAVI